MSTQTPLRIGRSPLHRQCLFQRHTPSTPRRFAAPSPRAFSSTPSRPRQKQNRLVDLRVHMAGIEATVYGQPAPNVAASSSSKHEAPQMTDDIGLLQNTVIRAPFSQLPRPWSWQFYSYFWTLIKARFTALYTRSHFNRCVHKRGMRSYLPVDFMKQSMLKNKAKKMYERYYYSLAAGDAKTLRSLCLPPLASALRSQIAARGPVKTSWQLLKFKSARIVSHRAAPLGADQPDTSYRQCVVRIESKQALSLTPVAMRDEAHKMRAPKWAPSGAQKTPVVAPAGADAHAGVERSQVQTVVEYLVMQTRVMHGKEEEWKVWGFAGETTPAKMEDDEVYWRKMLDVQAAA